MLKKFSLILSVLTIVTLTGAGSANASWWKHAWHKASHAVSHAAHVVATDTEKAAKAAAHFAKHEAYVACRKAMPAVLKAVVGKACKVAAAEVGGACNAALDVETSGMASVACDASAVVLYAVCKHEGKMAVNMINPIIDESCSKI
jgi:hypothetical protein